MKSRNQPKSHLALFSMHHHLHNALEWAVPLSNNIDVTYDLQSQLVGGCFLICTKACNIIMFAIHFTQMCLYFSLMSGST